MNTKSSLAEQLRDKDYRDAFVSSQIRIGLPMQCRALRESRDLTQPKLAELVGWSQPRVSELERPGVRKPNIETLLRLASALDVALQVRFVPFSQFIDDDDDIDFDNFYVRPFEEDINHLECLEAQQETVVDIEAYAKLLSGSSQEKLDTHPSDESAKQTGKPAAEQGGNSIGQAFSIGENACA